MAGTGTATGVQASPTVVNVERLLSLAEPRGPAGLPTPDAGAVLALACHVIMVQAGFQSTLPSGDNPSNRWAPQPHWTKEFKDEWRFSYTVPGKRNTLMLHCSLQRGSGRMLVHTLELGARNNDHLLGLLLPKYVPDESLLSQPSWAGVVANTDALVPMLYQHVIEPLLERAEEMPPADTSDWLEDNGQQQPHPSSLRGLWAAATGADGAGGRAGSGSYVVPAVLLTGLALTGVAAFVIMRRRPRRL